MIVTKAQLLKNELTIEDRYEFLTIQVNALLLKTKQNDKLYVKFNINNTYVDSLILDLEQAGYSVENLGATKDKTNRTSIKIKLES